MKSIVTLTLVLLSLTVAAQKPYLITGQLNGLEDGAIIALCKDEGNIITPVASDTLKAGKFTFRGMVDKSERLMLMGRGEGFPSMWLDLWVAPNATINISGSNKLVKTWDVQSPLAQQRELNSFIQASIRQLDEVQKLSVERTNLFLKGIPKDPIERKEMVRRMRNIDRTRDSIDNLINIKEAEALQHLPITTIWIDKLKAIAQFVEYKKDSILRESAIKLYSRLNRLQKETEVGYEISAALYPPKVVKKGEAMADTVLTNVLGKKRALSDYKGKYLLLDFWSIGCAPCIDSFRETKQVSEKYSDSLTVVGLSVDVKKAIWKEASDQHKISWENLSDGKGMRGIAAKYGVNGIPHYVVISPEGIVLGS